MFRERLVWCGGREGSCAQGDYIASVVNHLSSVCVILLIQFRQPVRRLRRARIFYKVGLFLLPRLEGTKEPVMAEIPFPLISILSGLNTHLPLGFRVYRYAVQLAFSHVLMFSQRVKRVQALEA